ncbi:MAG: acyl-CoA dehydrogenase family protein [Mycobacteriales bacterium]
MDPGEPGDHRESGERRELRAAVRAFLSAVMGPAVVRELMASDTGHDALLWRRLTGELGLAGLALPERYGGSGGRPADLAVALEEAGRALLPLPLWSTVTAAAAVLTAGSEEACAELLPPLASGARVATLAVAEEGSWDPARWQARVAAGPAGGLLDGVKGHVVDGMVADLFVVAAHGAGGLELFAVDADAPGVSAEPLATMDQTRRQAQVRFASAPARRLGAAGAEGVARALDHAAAGLAAEQVGAARRCLELTVDYVRVRHQFGRPIGSFQAVAHRCADLAVQVAAAEALARAAAAAAGAEAGTGDEGGAGAEAAAGRFAQLAPAAKAYCGPVFLHVTGEAIQLHGGIGFTWEHDAHLFFKRAKSTELLFGDARYQRALAAERAGLFA